MKPLVINPQNWQDVNPDDLRKALNILGLTRAELGRRIGILPQYVAAVVSGKRYAISETSFNSMKKLVVEYLAKALSPTYGDDTDTTSMQPVLNLLFRKVTEQRALLETLTDKTEDKLAFMLQIMSRSFNQLETQIKTLQERQDELMALVQANQTKKSWWSRS